MYTCWVVTLYIRVAGFTQVSLRETIKKQSKQFNYVSMEIDSPTAYPFPRPPAHPTFTLLIKPTIITIVLKKRIMIVSSSLKRSQTNIQNKEVILIKKCQPVSFGKVNIITFKITLKQVFTHRHFLSKKAMTVPSSKL